MNYKFHCLIHGEWKSFLSKHHTINILQDVWFNDHFKDELISCADQIYIEDSLGRTRLIKNIYGPVEYNFLSEEERNIKDILE